MFAYFVSGQAPERDMEIETSAVSEQSQPVAAEQSEPAAAGAEQSEPAVATETSTVASEPAVTSETSAAVSEPPVKIEASVVAEQPQQGGVADPPADADTSPAEEPEAADNSEEALRKKEARSVDVLL
jgi:hypothetical protein